MGLEDVLLISNSIKSLNNYQSRDATFIHISGKSFHSFSLTNACLR